MVAGVEGQRIWVIIDSVARAVPGGKITPQDGPITACPDAGNQG
jgi:hypothetical protein